MLLFPLPCSDRRRADQKPPPVIAPIIWLHLDDPWMPSDIATHVLHTTPKLGFESIPGLSTYDLHNLSALNDHGSGVFLTSDNTTGYADWLYGETPDDFGVLHNSTACAVVVVEKSPEDVDAFYFYFYSFNQGADITQVVPPLERLFPDVQPGNPFGNHVGDWEHNMIRFRNAKPVGVYFSQHTSGHACLWDDEACISKRGDRPVVFSARGSHANYPSKGSHVHDEALIDIADQGRIWDPIQPAYFYRYDPITQVFTPADSATQVVDWLNFDGAWGDKKYQDTDPRQSVVPYFGLRKFENGPNGPKFKQLVRKGLMPDHFPKDPMMKVLVRWYLSWYGCCLKGWNPWVVIISLLLVLVFLVALTVFAVKRLKPRVKRWLVDKLNRKTLPEQNEVQLRLLDPEQAEEDM